MTRYIVATKEGQGARPSDFSFCDRLEPVVFGFTCDTGGQSHADGACGCQRCFTGMDTRQGTTTARVAEIDATVDALVKRHADSLADAWDLNEATALEMAREDVTEIVRLAGRFPLGTVVERRQNVIQSRIVPVSAR